MEQRKNSAGWRLYVFWGCGNALEYVNLEFKEQDQGYQGSILSTTCFSNLQYKRPPSTRYHWIGPKGKYKSIVKIHKM